MDRYALSRPKRLVVRAIALAFFVLSAIDIASAPLPIVAPGLSAPAWSLSRGIVGEPELLLPEAARFRLASSPTERARFLSQLAEPRTRALHGLLSLAIDLPVILILCGMGMALWRSTRLVPEAVESGLPWLMTVGWASLFFAITYPIFDGMRSVVLLRGIMPTPPLVWYDPAAAGATYELLLIAAGILAATWTISAGLKARRDMAEIV